LWRVARDRSHHRCDLDWNESWLGISAQSTLARLSTPSEQQAVSHPVPARDAADRLASLQGLFDKANLLVVTPSPPTLGAQHIDLHSPRDLKARLKVKSSGRLSNYTRRPPPEGYREAEQVGFYLSVRSLWRGGVEAGLAFFKPKYRTSLTHAARTFD
jgi:hypothetical protein